MYAAGALGDVLQDVFDAFYERSPPSRSSAGELRRDLGKVSGVVILDAVDMDREGGQQLQLVLVRCSLVVVSRERVIWGDATPLQIRGLEPEFAIALIERELGRALEEAERGPAERICAALAGHPLRIREAVAPVRAEGRSLSQIADAIAGPGALEALAASRLAGADAQQRQLLATLAPFGGQAVGREHLTALLNTPDAPELIDGAVASGDLRAHSPRYSLGLTAADAARTLDPVTADAAGDRALAHFVRWAHDTHDQPQAQLVEGAALLALLRWAVDNGRLREAIELGRAIDAAFAVGRRFDAWRECARARQIGGPIEPEIGPPRRGRFTNSEPARWRSASSRREPCSCNTRSRCGASSAMASVPASPSATSRSAGASPGRDRRSGATRFCCCSIGAIWSPSGWPPRCRARTTSRRCRTGAARMTTTS